MTDTEHIADADDPAGEDLQAAVQYFVNHHEQVHAALMSLCDGHTSGSVAAAVHANTLVASAGSFGTFAAAG